jgi:hypothetical protein
MAFNPRFCHRSRRMDAERKAAFYQMALATIKAILLQQQPLDVPKLIELIDRLEEAAASED